MLRTLEGRGYGGERESERLLETVTGNDISGQGTDVSQRLMTLSFGTEAENTGTRSLTSIMI